MARTIRNGWHSVALGKPDRTAEPVSLGFFRGVLIGLLLVIPIWILIAWLVVRSAL